MSYCSQCAELLREAAALRVEVRWLREENDRLAALGERLRKIVIESGTAVMTNDTTKVQGVPSAEELCDAIAVLDIYYGWPEQQTTWSTVRAFVAPLLAPSPDAQVVYMTPEALRIVQANTVARPMVRSFGDADYSVALQVIGEKK